MVWYEGLTAASYRERGIRAASLSRHRPGREGKHCVSFSETNWVCVKKPDSYWDQKSSVGLKKVGVVWWLRAGLVLRFWWNFDLMKFLQNLAKVLAKLSAIFLLPELFPCPPPKKLVEKLHILCSLIFPFFSHNFEITILLNSLTLWQNFGKIQSFWPKFLRNFPWNNDEIFGAATLNDSDIAIVLRVSIQFYSEYIKLTGIETSCNCVYLLLFCYL